MIELEMKGLEKIQFYFQSRKIHQKKSWILLVQSMLLLASGTKV